MSCNAPLDSGTLRRDIDPRLCGIYSRLETDEEFAMRVSGGPMINAQTRQPLIGEQLDECAWRVWKKQRRIIEVIP